MGITIHVDCSVEMVRSCRFHSSHVSSEAGFFFLRLFSAASAPSLDRLPDFVPSVPSVVELGAVGMSTPDGRRKVAGSVEVVSGEGCKVELGFLAARRSIPAPPD